jgi:hypothetical protein
MDTVARRGLAQVGHSWACHLHVPDIGIQAYYSRGVGDAQKETETTDRVCCSQSFSKVTREAALEMEPTTFSYTTPGTHTGSIQQFNVFTMSPSQPTLLAVTAKTMLNLHP